MQGCDSRGSSFLIKSSWFSNSGQEKMQNKKTKNKPCFYVQSNSLSFFPLNFTTSTTKVEMSSAIFRNFWNGVCSLLLPNCLTVELPFGTISFRVDILPGCGTNCPGFENDPPPGIMTIGCCRVWFGYFEVGCINRLQNTRIKHGNNRGPGDIAVAGYIAPFLLT